MAEVKGKSEVQEILWRVLSRSCALGVLGGATGGLISAFRPTSYLPAYIVGVGTNFAVLGIVYFGANEALKLSPVFPKVKYHDHMRHATSGAFMGGLGVAIYSGKRYAPAGALLWGLFGFAGYSAYEKMEEWRVHEGIKRRQERADKA